jgi:hypothetical protein
MFMFTQFPTSTLTRSSISGLSTKRLTSTLNDTGCFIKNGPRYNFAIDDQMKKKYTRNEMAQKHYKSE